MNHLDIIKIARLVNEDPSVMGRDPRPSVTGLKPASQMVDPWADKLKTGEDRRRHFGITGTGSGRTDDSVIFNDMRIEDDGYAAGELIVWFEDSRDLEETEAAEGDIVIGYADINGRWHIKIAYTVILSVDPNKEYPPDTMIQDREGQTAWPSTLPDEHGSGIVRMIIRDHWRNTDPDY